MKITKVFTVDTTKEIDKLIDRLKFDCADTAGDLLQDLPISDEEYLKYKDELTKELFDDVLTKLAFEYNEEG